MKIAAFVILGIAVAGVVYSLGPDIARYIKIKSM
jgi:hypothetical protein